MNPNTNSTEDEIPKSFMQAVDDVKAGRIVDLETVLSGLPPTMMNRLAIALLSRQQHYGECRDDARAKDPKDWSFHYFDGRTDGFREAGELLRSIICERGCPAPHAFKL